MPSSVLVTGSVAWDCVMSFPGRFQDHILPDKLHTLNVSFLADRMRRIRGGCAANIAYSCALHGLGPRLVAAVGSDFREYRDWLTSHGIDTRSVRVFEDVLTASCVITTDAQGGQITGFFPGAMARAREVALRDLEGARPDIAIVSPNDPEAMKLYPGECRALGIPFVYDPGQQMVALDGPALLLGIKGARAFVVNEYELDVATKKTGRRATDMLELAESVVVTLGERGARVISRDGKGPVEVPAVKLTRFVDPVGAGDSFRGGLLRGLVQGLDWASCLRLGALTAAFCIEGGGTTCYTFSREAFEARYREAYGVSCPPWIG